jgi:hypothetical protein
MAHPSGKVGDDAGDQFEQDGLAGAMSTPARMSGWTSTNGRRPVTPCFDLVAV